MPDIQCDRQTTDRIKESKSGNHGLEIDQEADLSTSSCNGYKKRKVVIIGEENLRHMPDTGWKKGKKCFLSSIFVLLLIHCNSV